MSETKTMDEVCNEFLASVLEKADDQLLAILNQDFTYDYDCSGRSDIYNISNIHLQDDNAGMTILENSDFCSYGFQILAILAALQKEQTFNCLKSHLENISASNRTNGYAYYMVHEGDGFNGTLEEAEAMRNDPNAGWCWAPWNPELHVLNFYRLEKTDSSDDEIAIDLKKCSYQSLRDSINVIDDSIWLSLPKTSFENDFPTYNLTSAEDSNVKEFEFCSKSPEDVTLKISLQPLCD